MLATAPPHQPPTVPVPLRRANLHTTLPTNTPSPNITDAQPDLSPWWIQLRNASVDGDQKTVSFLIGIGMSPDYRDENGFTAAHYSTIFQQSEVTKYLVSVGANIEQISFDGETALQCSCRSASKDAEVLAYLLSIGAKVNTFRYSDGYTPLHDAHDRENCLNLLVRAGANVHAKNNKGLTPLQLARLHKSHTVSTLAKLTIKVCAMKRAVRLCRLVSFSKDLDFRHRTLLKLIILELTKPAFAIVGFDLFFEKASDRSTLSSFDEIPSFVQDMLTTYANVKL